MGAFIVPDKTINQIVTFLLFDDRCSGYHFKQLDYAIRTDEGAEKLARDLYLMNCDAVDQRYSKGTAAKDVGGHLFQFRLAYETKIQVYKSACCLRYQCSEGNVTERPLYAALSAFCAALAHQLVTERPDYEVAKWGN